MPNSAERKTYALFQTPTNKKLIAELQKSSHNIFLFPPLKTESAKLTVEEITLIKKIDEFDWLIFPDVLSVDYFLEFLRAFEKDFFELDAVRVCAFGEIVADRLRFSQIHADVIPTDLNAGTIFSAIFNYAGEKEVNNSKMLLMKEISTDFEIAILLAEARADLIEMAIYKAEISDKSEIIKLKTLLKSGAIDEFIFSAPEDLIALLYYFPKKDELSEIFSEVKAAANDVNIFHNLKENNIKARYFIRQ